MRKLFATESFMAAALLILIVSTVFHSYILFHINVEIFSTLIAFSIFVFGWNTQHNFKNGYLLVIAVAYLFVGFLDIFHALAYESMNIFDYPANFAIELWISARLMEAVTFVVAYFFINRPVPAYRVMSAYLAATLFFVAMIYADFFPDCYVDGEGLTAFKVAAEYVIMAILGLSLWLLKISERLSAKVKRLLAIAIILTIFGEMSFTLYHDMFGIFNIIGHVLKVVSFYLLYKAILSVGLSEPMELLSTRLEKAEADKRKQEQILIQQSRVAAMGEMVSAIAHHWRQPLNVVAMTVQSLRDEYDEGRLDGPKLDKAIGITMDKLNEMSRTVDSLRGIIPSNEGAKRCCVLDEVKAAYALISSELELSRITLEADCFGNGYKPIGECFCKPDNKQWVRLISSEFRQVVFNVLINARDAILSRRAETGPDFKGIIRMNLDFEGSYEKLTIEDNGGGIAEESIDRLFEPFYTTKERGRGKGVITGVGVGLYLAKMVVEEHMGGKITASNGKEGAKITILLPLEG